MKDLATIIFAVFVSIGCTDDSDANAGSGTGGTGGTGSGAGNPDAGTDASTKPKPKPDPEPPGTVRICPAGKDMLGQFAIWAGKVNVHTDSSGDWEVDNDCSSGAGEAANVTKRLNYCKKFYADTTAYTAFSPTDATLKPFTEGGGTAPTCGGLHNNKGQTQYVCCGESNPCGNGFKTVSQFAIWAGKVNVHLSNDDRWVVDSDCSSGSNNNDEAYCNDVNTRLNYDWGTSTKVVEVPPTPRLKPFTAGGCGQEYPHPGSQQFACCVPTT